MAMSTNASSEKTPTQVLQHWFEIVVIARTGLCKNGGNAESVVTQSASGAEVIQKKILVTSLMRSTKGTAPTTSTGNTNKFPPGNSHNVTTRDIRLAPRS